MHDILNNCGNEVSKRTIFRILLYIYSQFVVLNTRLDRASFIIMVIFTKKMQVMVIRAILAVNHLPPQAPAHPAAANPPIRLQILQTLPSSNRNNLQQKWVKKSTQKHQLLNIKIVTSLFWTVRRRPRLPVYFLLDEFYYVFLMIYHVISQ